MSGLLNGRRCGGLSSSVGHHLPNNESSDTPGLHSRADSHLPDPYSYPGPGPGPGPSGELLASGADCPVPTKYCQHPADTRGESFSKGATSSYESMIPGCDSEAD